MPRKFRIAVHRKNEFRKLRAKKLSLPIDISELKVSIPRKIFADAPLSTIATLRQRLKIAIVLPEGT